MTCIKRIKRPHGRGGLTVNGQSDIHFCPWCAHNLKGSAGPSGAFCHKARHSKSTCPLILGWWEPASTSLLRPRMTCRSMRGHIMARRTCTCTPHKLAMGAIYGRTTSEFEGGTMALHFFSREEPHSLSPPLSLSISLFLILSSSGMITRGSVDLTLRYTTGMYLTIISPSDLPSCIS